jgi:hypothetical protein
MPFLKVNAWSAAASPIAGAKLISIWPGPYSALDVMTSTPTCGIARRTSVTNPSSKLLRRVAKIWMPVKGGCRSSVRTRYSSYS